MALQARREPCLCPTHGGLYRAVGNSRGGILSHRVSRDPLSGLAICIWRPNGEGKILFSVAYSGHLSRFYGGGCFFDVLGVSACRSVSIDATMAAFRSNGFG